MGCILVTEVVPVVVVYCGSVVVVLVLVVTSDAVRVVMAVVVVVAIVVTRNSTMTQPVMGSPLKLRGYQGRARPARHEQGLSPRALAPCCLCYPTLHCTSSQLSMRQTLNQIGHEQDEDEEANTAEVDLVHDDCAPFVAGKPRPPFVAGGRRYFPNLPSHQCGSAMLHGAFLQPFVAG